MARPGRLLLLVATLAATVGFAPAHAATTCTSEYPVTDKHVASYRCTGVFPGMALHVPSKKYGEMTCTAGFVFSDQFGNKYLTVPGSCYLDFDCLEDVVVDLLPPPLNEIARDLLPCLLASESELEPFWAKNGPPVADANDHRIGALVYAVNKDGINFALVRLDKGVKPDPAVPLYGGPTKLAAPSGTLEEAYVFARYAGVQPNAMTGYLQPGYNVAYHSPGNLFAGLGAPVVKAADGAGVGYYVGMNLAYGGVVAPYGPALARALRHTKLSLKLVSAPQAG